MTRPPLIAVLLRCVPEFPHRTAAIVTVAAAVIAPMTAQAAPPSPQAQALRAHVLAQRDHGGMPFAVIDKQRAHLWLFDGRGTRRGDSPVLLGAARGDDSEPGIGDKPLAAVMPHERTTPAGRFVVEHGRNLRGEDVLWIDYDAAVSMHRLLTTPVARQERRAERLASRTPVDNRISYGCINVPRAFFERRLLPWAAGTTAVVYVLPETRPWRTVFDAPARAAVPLASSAATDAGPPLAVAAR